MIQLEDLLTAEQLALIPQLERDRRERLLKLLKEHRRRDEQRKFFRLFPDRDYVRPSGETIYRRELYPRHLEFFAAGARYRERCFLAGNRVGKTVAGAFEMTCHLTGLYPHWWTGRRFKHPIRAWAAGETNETTRDIVQAELLGEVVHDISSKRVSGTGMIPGHLLGSLTWKGGSDLADIVQVRHVSGRWSSLGIKSYQQKRGAFQGTAQHVIWLDEECPIGIYGECLMRTATTRGIVLLTFTPLLGITRTVLQFLPKEMRPMTESD